MQHLTKQPHELGASFGLSASLAEKKVKTYQFIIGDRIVPSAEGLQTFRSWANRRGTIIGNSRDHDVWQVKWDGSTTVELIHADFIAPASTGPIRRQQLTLAGR